MRLGGVGVVSSVTAPASVDAEAIFSWLNLYWQMPLALIGFLIAICQIRQAKAVLTATVNLNTEKVATVKSLVVLRLIASASNTVFCVPLLASVAVAKTVIHHILTL